MLAQIDPAAWGAVHAAVTAAGGPCQALHPLRSLHERLDFRIGRFRQELQQVL
jgi:hypothetical protein